MSGSTVAAKGQDQGKGKGREKGKKGEENKGVQIDLSRLFYMTKLGVMQLV